MMRRPNLRHRMEYVGYRAAVAVFGLLPERIALGLAGWMGWVAGVVLGVRRRVVREHLRLAFPSANESWRRRTARASFRHVGRESLATFLLGRMSREEVIERTELGGFSVLQEALSRGRGAVLITAHFGNWEIAGASLALREVPLDVVAQRQRNPLFDTDINGTRERMGMKVIPRSVAPKEVLRSLRRGRAVAILGDQNVRKGGVFVDFFGKKASTARGAAIFALRTGSPVFMGVNRRLPGYPPRYHLEILPVEFTPSGNMEDDVLRLTQLHTNFLEREVSRAPDQYFWQHRRWKTRPPAEEEGCTS